MAFLGPVSSGKTALLRRMTGKDPVMHNKDTLRSRHGGRDYFEPRKAHIKHTVNMINGMKCSVVYVFDVSPSSQNPEKQLKDYIQLKEYLPGKKIIHVANKIDIADTKKLHHLKKNVPDIHEVSAHDGKGMSDLVSSIEYTK